MTGRAAGGEGGSLAGQVRRRAAGAGIRAAPASAASPSARCSRPSWQGEAASRPTSSRSRACWRRWRGSSASSVEVVAGEEPFLHPGRSAGSWSAAAASGWIGELHPLVCRAWDLPEAAALRDRPGAARRRLAAGGETYEDVITFPAVHQDIAVVVADDVAAAERSARRSSRAAASCCARPRSSTSTGASRSARAARASPCGSSSAPPTAPSPTRRSPSAARAIDAELAEIGGSLRE